MGLNEAMAGRAAVHRSTIAIVMFVSFGASCTSANEQSNDLFFRADPQSVNHMKEVSRINITTEADSSGIDSIAWNADSSEVAVLTNQGTNIQAYDTRSRTMMATFDPSEYGVRYGAPIFFTGKKTVAAGFTLGRSEGYSPALAAWDLSRGKQVGRLPRPVQGSPALALASSRLFNVSQDGQLIAAVMQEVQSTEDYNTEPHVKIEIIATDSGSEIKSISLPQAGRLGPSSLTFTPDAKALAVGTFSGSVLLVDLGTGRLQTIIPDGRAEGASLAFSRSGETVAVGYAPMGAEQPFAGVVELWSVATKVRLTTLEMPIFSYHGEKAQPDVHSLAWDWAHDRLAVGAGDSVRVWSNVSRKPELQFSQRMPTNGAGFVSYLPYKVTFSNNGTLAIATGKTIAVYR